MKKLLFFLHLFMASANNTCVAVVLPDYVKNANTLPKDSPLHPDFSPSQSLRRSEQEPVVVPTAPVPTAQVMSTPVLTTPVLPVDMSGVALAKTEPRFIPVKQKPVCAPVNDVPQIDTRVVDTRVVDTSVIEKVLSMVLQHSGELAQLSTAIRNLKQSPDNTEELKELSKKLTLILTRIDDMSVNNTGVDDTRVTDSGTVNTTKKKKTLLEKASKKTIEAVLVAVIIVIILQSYKYISRK